MSEKSSIDKHQRLYQNFVKPKVISLSFMIIFVCTEQFSYIYALSRKHVHGYDELSMMVIKSCITTHKL